MGEGLRKKDKKKKKKKRRDRASESHVQQEVTKDCSNCNKKKYKRTSNRHEIRMKKNYICKHDPKQHIFKLGNQRKPKSRKKKGKKKPPQPVTAFPQTTHSLTNTSLCVFPSTLNSQQHTHPHMSQRLTGHRDPDSMTLPRHLQFRHPIKFPIKQIPLMPIRDGSE
jgi:FtsZ-interacting cell division protein ZipA